MKFIEKSYSVLFNKCPKCHKGDVFKVKNPYSLKNMFNMFDHCEHCQLKYERETGFFYGAMYVSYALTSGWFLLWFLLYLTVLDWDTFYFALFVTVTIILLSPLVLRLSRLIWLNLFFSYNPEGKEK
jgi:hypothetical protein